MLSGLSRLAGALEPASRGAGGKRLVLAPAATAAELAAAGKPVAGAAWRGAPAAAQQPGRLGRAFR